MEAASYHVLTGALIVSSMLAGLGDSILNLAHLPWLEQLVGRSAGNELRGLGDIITSGGGVVCNEVAAAEDRQLGTNGLGLAGNGKG